MPLFVNATLTKVAAYVDSEDYDHAAGAEAPTWTGSEGAFVSERLLTALDEGGVDRKSETRVLIDGNITVLRGNTITYSYAGSTFTRIVREVLHQTWGKNLVGQDLLLDD